MLNKSDSKIEGALKTNHCFITALGPQPSTIFKKRCMLHVWQGSEYNSECYQLSCYPFTICFIVLRYKKNYFLKTKVLFRTAVNLK